MRCALASKGFINGNTQYNKRVIIDTLIDCSPNADIVIFGKAFLQGFYAATFRAEQDARIAVSINDSIIKEIRTAAQRSGTAVSFGLIEKAEGCFFSSQITIGCDGNIIDVYRRVSPGWKEAFANDKYREGDGFHTFSFMGTRIAVGLCGDLWYDENIDRIKQANPDVVFWPVCTDYSFDDWNTSAKYEYAAQAAKIGRTVLYVNPFCLGREGDGAAKGGSALFADGFIRQEIPVGKEDVLFIVI